MLIHASPSLCVLNVRAISLISLISRGEQAGRDSVETSKRLPAFVRKGPRVRRP